MYQDLAMVVVHETKEEEPALDQHSIFSGCTYK